MSAKKYTIDQGTKIIYKYPTPTKEFDLGYMIVKGRHPENPRNFIHEHACQFVMYVTKGSGKVYAGEDIFTVASGDVIFVPTDNAFAVEGDLEYVTVDVPAFYPEQSEERTHE